jgi:hypothetical protein
LSGCFQTMGAPTGLTCARRLRKTCHPAEADSPLPPANQRQGRALPPHSGRRVGIYMPAAIGQNSSAERDWKHGCITTTTTDPHCLRQSAALHAIDQRPRSVHLVLSLACTTTVFLWSPRACATLPTRLCRQAIPKAWVPGGAVQRGKGVAISPMRRRSPAGSVSC